MRNHITQPNKNITTISREFNPLSKRQRLTLNWTLVESKPKLFGNTLHLKQWEADDDQKKHQINAPFAECRSHRDKKIKEGDFYPFRTTILICYHIQQKLNIEIQFGRRNKIKNDFSYFFSNKI